MSLHDVYLTLLAAGGVLLLSVAAARLADRVGLPVLLAFLGVGVLLGEDVLGLRFDDAALAQALGTAALAIILLSAWGWRRGERWVWWTLALAAVAGFGPAAVVHALIHYTSFEHVLPVYLGIGLTTAALTLARPHLCDRCGPASQSETPRRP